MAPRRSKKLANGPDLYGGGDPRELPRYTYSEARRATNVPESTIAAWVRGMSYTRQDGTSGFFEPVITRPVPADSRLSFNNLVEVHVLRALREVHEVRLGVIRTAIQLAKNEHGIDRLLIDRQLRTTGGKLFLDYYFKLVELSESRQFAMRTLLHNYLLRVKIDDRLKKASFYPLPRVPSLGNAEPILVSPYVAFGAAVIQRRGISTSAIAGRLNVGEKRATIIADYRISEEEFEEAILYEAA